MINQYLSNPREFIRKLRTNKQLNQKIISTYSEGLLKGYCVFGFPVFLKQINPNFKKKLFVYSVPILSLKRKAPNSNPVKHEDEERSPRLYISLGSLPYFDNRSGIPRVAKNLCYEGLKCRVRDCIPVYPDPVSGKYRVAYQWCKNQSLSISALPNVSSDEEITVKNGDWLIHTMINSNELEYEQSYLDSFRALGGKIGFILYDIIAEEHPDFFKNRDSKLFGKWLREIVQSDAIFTNAESTKRAFLSWAKKEEIIKLPPCEVFHLGVDFSRLEKAACTYELPRELKETPYFLQVSTIEPRKGYAQLLDVFEKLWSQGTMSNLVFVGRQGWCVKPLIRRIKTHPQLNQHLFWFNGVGDEQLLALYRSAKGVVVASEAEGFGLSVIEGQYFKKPVIARDIPVFREIGKDAISYFKTQEDLAIKIEDLLKNNESIQSQSVNWITWEQSFYNLLDCIQRTQKK